VEEEENKLKVYTHDGHPFLPFLLVVELVFFSECVHRVLIFMKENLKRTGPTRRRKGKKESQNLLVPSPLSLKTIWPMVISFPNCWGSMTKS
jgi:hypothetical protein